MSFANWSDDMVIRSYGHNESPANEAYWATTVFFPRWNGVKYAIHFHIFILIELLTNETIRYAICFTIGFK